MVPIIGSRSQAILSLEHAFDVPGGAAWPWQVLDDVHEEARHRLPSVGVATRAASLLPISQAPGRSAPVLGGQLPI